MRVILSTIVVVVATTLGIHVINTVDAMQDNKLSRFCKSVPVGASYDDLCKDYR